MAEQPVPGGSGAASSASNKDKYSCMFCDKRFTQAWNLKRHLVSIHNDAAAKGKCTELPSDRRPFVCDKCTVRISFPFHADLLSHFEEQHGFVAKRSTLQFDSSKEFSIWMAAEESKEHVHFVLHTGGKRSKGGEMRRKYYCHRSGSFQSESKGERQLKTQGSCKSNVKCLAAIKVTEKDGKVAVEYQAEHYGHLKELKHQPLSKTEKEALAAKLKQGIPARKVLVDARASGGSEMGRLHLLTMKDIGNISVQHEIQTKERRHKDQFVSVEMWVEELNRQLDSPVLYFQQQTQKDTCDFELALMTAPQKDLLAKLGPKFLCIDSTHGTNGHNLQLTTLMTVAEDQSGMPCAYLISKKVDAETMIRFFEAIKEQIGKLECEAFMSDDAPAYGNAWEHVMGPVKNRMLCTWHVNRSWKGKLQKVTNEEIRKTLQDQLFSLRNCSNEVEFQEALPRFLNQKLGKEGKDFLKYFRSHYAGRATQWAHCFRKGIPFTTNNHLEAMHRDLKSNYMHGTHNQRLDKLLMILLELTRDRLYKRLKSLIKGKTNRHATALFQRHQDGMKIPASDVEKLQNGSGWLVKSQSQAGTNYNVERKGDPCQGCILRCKECNICIDSYQCTCNDSLISVSICKHIHAVAYLERRATTVEEVKTQPDMVPSTSCNVAGSTLVDEPQSLLDNIRHSVESSMQKSEPDSEDEIHLALNALNESLSRKRLISASSRAMVVEYLAKAKELVDSAPDASCLKPKLVPHNKKMEKQPRYISIKRRRPGSGSMHVKRPNRLEQQSIMKDLLDNRVSSRVAASTWLPVDAAALVLRDHDYCAEQ